MNRNILDTFDALFGGGIFRADMPTAITEHPATIIKYSPYQVESIERWFYCVNSTEADDQIFVYVLHGE